MNLPYSAVWNHSGFWKEHFWNDKNGNFGQNGDLPTLHYLKNIYTLEIKMKYLVFNAFYYLLKKKKFCKVALNYTCQINAVEQKINIYISSEIQCGERNKMR